MSATLRLFAGASFLAIVAVTAAGCSHLFGSEKEAPSLSRRPGSSVGNPTAKTDVADNSRCYVCHANYDGEQLVTMHAAKNVGCETCHGASDDHCGDEGHLTPPDMMYAKEDINAMCRTCHASSNEQYCTDCHGNHRLPHRTRQWDKKTHKLISAE